MRFEELTKKMQKGLLNRTRKNLVVGTVVLCALLLGIAALISAIGHNMWILAVFPVLVAVVGIVNLFMELSSPSNCMDESVRNADYSFSTPSASEPD
jgi:type IV secretory pathway TrbD component